MTRTSNVVAGVVAALVVALLIVCVGLLSAIFAKQKSQESTSASVTQTPAPALFKDVIILADGSNGVDSALLGKEADFFSNQLRTGLLSKAGAYSIRIAASAISSQLSSKLSFVDAQDATAVKGLANVVRQSKTDQALNLNTVLASLIPKRRSVPQGQYTLVVMASGQGVDYASAVKQANSLKNSGVAIVAISLKPNQDLTQFASEGAALDGQAIQSGDSQQMASLADHVTAIVDKQPPVTIPTTVITSTPVEITTPVTTPVTAPITTPVTTLVTAPITTPVTTVTTTTPPKPVNTRVVVLVDASSGVKQQEMIKQASFVSSELLSELMYPSLHGYDTGMLMVPFAFDTSPDNSEFIRLDSSEHTLEIANQAMNTKLAPITSFIEPLNALHIGQALQELDTQMKTIPTHVVVLASSQGTDFSKAVTMAKKMTANNINIIPVATVGAVNDLSGIASNSACVLDGRDILKAQNLKSMASNIAKCIYPASALPAPKQKVIIKQKPVQPKAVHKQVLEPVAKPFAPNTANQIVLLVDTSTDAVRVVGKQTDFINNHLLNAFKSTFSSDPPHVALIPYAFFSAAVAEQFVDPTNNSLINDQIRTVAIAHITTFTPPLDQYELIGSFNTLTDRFFLNSTKSKVILFTNDRNPSINDALIESARVLTGNHTKPLVVVSLNSKQDEYSQIAKPGGAFDGVSVLQGNSTAQQILATKITNALKNPTKRTMVHVPRHINPILD